MPQATKGSQKIVCEKILGRSAKAFGILGARARMSSLRRRLRFFEVNAVSRLKIGAPSGVCVGVGQRNGYFDG